MFRAVAISVVMLFATPAAAVQLACVDHKEQMVEASARYGETLQWAGANQYGQPFWFFASRAKQTWTVWFRLPDQRICTGPGYVGEINDLGGQPV
jgi:hypothetical protein|tara:strand:- start:251 stop:535 length:285 start_codon:yes stop_codon:yes gene_type:complete